MITLDEYFLSQDKSWWCMDRDDNDSCGKKVAHKVIKTVQDIEQRQSSIHEGNRRHAKIYSGYLPIGLGRNTGATGAVRNPFPATKGVVRSVCDTATALIVRSRPRAAFVTDGGDWKTQIQAEDLEQFSLGAYSQADIYNVAPRCFHDSTVFGTGIWKYVPRGKGSKFVVKTERVLPDDFIVDEEECPSDLTPANTYHRMVVRAEALVAKYASKNPELARAIYAACGNKTWLSHFVPRESVTIIEAIHIDEDNPANNKRVLCGDGFVLKDEKWAYPWHPYTIVWWQPPISGFYGDGIAYRQYGRQERINYMYRWVQRCHDLFATPRAWVDPSGGPPSMHMSTEIGQVISARKPPVFQVQDCVPPEIYKWLDNLESGGYEDEGISQMSAQNQLPPGVDSAPAQREYSYKEGQRFAPVSQRWEYALACETATKLIAFYRNHAQSTKEAPRVKWADRKMMYTIEWPDLDEDAYMIRPQAANSDSLSPAARLQSALELAQTGWLLPGEGRELVAHPDLQEADEFGNAGITYAKFVVRALYRGETVAIDDKADLPTLDRIVRQGRLLAKQRKAPSEVIAALDAYLDGLDALQKEIETTLMVPPGGMAPPTNQASVPFAPGE